MFNSTPTPAFETIDDRAEAMETLPERALLLIDALLAAHFLGTFDEEAPALLAAYYAQHFAPAFPQWMHKLVEVDEARKAAEAAAQAEADAQAAAMQRLLGANLVEVLAFLLDVALPAPETNEIVLDGVHFSLDRHDIEPFSRSEAGEVTHFHFTLRVAGDVQPDAPRYFQFASICGDDGLRTEMEKLAEHVMYLVTFSHSAA
jgi:hypothetical protein